MRKSVFSRTDKESPFYFRTLQYLLYQGYWNPISALLSTGWMEWMSRRKQRETKQQPSMLLGPAVPGCCFVSFCFLWDIHSIHSLQHSRFRLVFMIKFTLSSFEAMICVVKQEVEIRRERAAFSHSSQALPLLVLYCPSLSLRTRIIRLHDFSFCPILF